MNAVDRQHADTRLEPKDLPKLTEDTEISSENGLLERGSVWNSMVVIWTDCKN